MRTWVIIFWQNRNHPLPRKDRKRDESGSSFAALYDEGLQPDAGAQTADLTGDVVGEIALERPKNATAPTTGRHLRGQPTTVVGLPDQLQVIGAKPAGGVPRVHVAPATVPEVQSGLAVRAQHHQLVRLGAQVGDGAVRAAPAHGARVDGVHPVASQIGQVQHVPTGSRLRQCHVQHVPPPGAVVRDGFGQHHPVTAARRHVPDDHGPSRRVRHVHERLAVVPVVGRNVVQAAGRAHQAG